MLRFVFYNLSLILEITQINKGKWLLESGFEPGDKVLVTVRRHQIILEKEMNYEEV
ncbi:SymE family type I addiction module toxin [Chryseobacterium sp.]|uniref:SymE family type I addiction module toxin n=1 Tax=unclassified Chryseobacterium TaxID=2593645 RepID=UPI0039182BAA